jgi:hypothetical protein
MKLKVYQILNIIGLVAVLVMNYLANALPIGGRTTGEVSANFPSLFTPAGFTFSIWGLIYLLLILFAFYQSKGLFGNSNLKQNRFLYRIDIWFFVSCIANTGWLLAWHHQMFVMSLVMIVGLLFSLGTIYLQLGAGRRIISRDERVFVHLPFSIYFGWVTVATIANVSIFLLKINWNRFGLTEEFWAAIMIGTASIIGILVLLSRKDFFFGLVIVWALFGIISKRIAGGTEAMEPVILVAGGGILLILAISIFLAVKRFLKKPLDA